MYKGMIDRMDTLGVKECMRVKEQAVMAASEAAELIMRVDDIVKCAPRKRERAWWVYNVQQFINGKSELERELI